MGADRIGLGPRSPAELAGGPAPLEAGTSEARAAFGPLNASTPTIGTIDLHGTFALVDVQPEAAALVLERAALLSLNGRVVRVSPARPSGAIPISQPVAAHATPTRHKGKTRPGPARATRKRHKQTTRSGQAKAVRAGRR